jgi:hypothetical protein
MSCDMILSLGPRWKPIAAETAARSTIVGSGTKPGFHDWSEDSIVDSRKVVLEMIFSVERPSFLAGH